MAVYREILRLVGVAHPPLASIFEHAAVVELTEARVVLGFEAQSFAATQATTPEAIEAMTRAVREYFGAPTQVAIDLSARETPKETVAIADAARRKEEVDKARALVAGHPLVVEALRLFDAELREIILPAENASERAEARAT